MGGIPRSEAAAAGQFVDVPGGFRLSRERDNIHALHLYLAGVTMRLSIFAAITLAGWLSTAHAPCGLMPMTLGL